MDVKMLKLLGLVMLGVFSVAILIGIFADILLKNRLKEMCFIVWVMAGLGAIVCAATVSVMNQPLCSYCEIRMDADAKYCSNCGELLIAEETQNEENFIYER